MKLLTPVAAFGLAIAVAACGENLDSGPVCPALCPGPVVDLRETVIEPVVLDTVITGLPPIGGETHLLLADRPGVVVAYGVVRFDTLFSTYIVTDDEGSDTLPITELDSAFLRLKFDTTSTTATQPVLLELFDVGAAAGDTVTSEIVGIIESSTPFADTSITVAGLTALGDSLRFVIPKEFLQEKVTQAAADPTTALRVGIRLTSAEPAQLRAVATNFGVSSPLLIYDPLPSDTSVHPISIAPYSKTPEEPPGLASRLRDFTVFALGSPQPGPAALAVGGLPGRRSYFRFDIPSELIDSTTIVRATLILYPTGESVGGDSLTIVPQIGTASPVITDPRRQTLLAVDATGGPYFVDSVRVAPGSLDSVTVDIVNLVPTWRAFAVDTLPRVLVLRSGAEGSLPEQVVFHSSEAADPAKRPRLRIRYIPAVDFGLP